MWRVPDDRTGGNTESENSLVAPAADSCCPTPDSLLKVYFRSSFSFFAHINGGIFGHSVECIILKFYLLKLFTGCFMMKSSWSQ